MSGWGRLLLAALLTTAPAAAQADSIGDALRVVGSVLTFVPGLQGWGLALIYLGSIQSGVEQRRRLRAERARRVREFNEALQARNITALTAEPPVRGGYGRCISGGDVVAIFTTDKAGVREDGTAYTKPDALQHLVIHFLSRQAEAIHEVYIDGQAVGTLDVDGVPTGGPFLSTRDATRQVQIGGGGSVSISEAAVEILNAWTVTGTGIDAVNTSVTATIGGGGFTITGPANAWVNYRVTQSNASVRIRKLLGAPDQTVDTYLQGLVPTKWTSNHRLRGLCCLIVTLDLEDQRFQAGIPNITAEGSWARVYDPRKDSTVPGGSGSHRANDPSTWEWSDNNALCTRDWLCSELGHGCAPGDIDEAYTIAAANACEVTGTFDDGSGTYTGARYTCNGTFTSEMAREAVLEDLTESMAGAAVPAGKWQIMAGAWTPPVADLTDDDLHGSIEVLQADTDTSELINSARGRYIPTGKSQPAEANPPYSNAMLVTADQGVKLWTDFTFPFTNRNARCRDLLRIRVEQSRSGLVIQYPAKLRLWGLRVGERVRLTSATYGFNAKAFRITDRRYTQATPVMLTLQEDDASIWDQADAATADPTPNTELPNPWAVSAVASLAASSGTTQLLRLEDGSVVPRVQVTWSAITDARVVLNGRVLVSWRRNTDLTWHNLAPVPGDATSVIFSGPKEGDRLVIRAQVRNDLGALSNVASIGHTVVGKTQAPANVAGLSATQVPGGVLVQWTGNSEADYMDTEIRSGASWATGTLVWRGTADRYLLPWPAAGSLTLWLAHRDSSRNYSGTPQSVGLTVDGTILIGTPQINSEAATTIIKATTASDTHTVTNLSTVSDRTLSSGSWTNNTGATVEVEVTFSAERSIVVSGGYSGSVDAFGFVALGTTSSGNELGYPSSGINDVIGATAGQTKNTKESVAWSVQVFNGATLYYSSVYRLLPNSGSGQVVLESRNVHLRLAVIKR